VHFCAQVLRDDGLILFEKTLSKYNSFKEFTLRHTDHPIHPQFTERWSPRAFADTAMSEAELLPLLEAARWAPSASNNQPWRCAYGLRGDVGFAKIADGLVPFNRAWASNAAALVVMASANTVTRDGVEKPNPWASFDAGAAWMALALQAHHAGLVTHAMGGFDVATLAKSLGMPNNYVIRAVLAIGKTGNVANLPEILQSREALSQRNPVAQFAGHGKFL
jgi:nitroreductase